MAKGLGYGDAVRLLGGEKSKIVGLLDTLVGGAMLAAAGPVPGVLGWFDAKAELTRVSQELVRGAAERRNGLSRYGRTERLEAAHAVIVVVAFFDALDDVDLPVPAEEWELTEAEQLQLAGSRTERRYVISQLFGTDTPLPGPGRPRAGFRDELRQYYRNFAVRLGNFLVGLVVWERLDPTARDRLLDLLHDPVPELAVRRYEGLFRRLATDFPEVAFWAGLGEHEATRADVRELGVALAGLERMLREISVGAAPDERRSALARAYKAALGRPIVESGDVPAGLRVPTLGDGYVPPLCRIAPLDAGARPSDESWWALPEVRDDLPDFLTGYLTSSEATRAPLLVLGQPGSGKSVLTRVLAGRLPATDFLPVRVVLRDVPAAADLQEQIEYAIRADTGERLDWPALARSAGDALPVVLLDGFDELLQATGVSQSDYLLKVAAFQRREADQGRPVVVVVTSRTSVADRAQPPEGTVALRLEPFDEQRVTAWLEIWNDANAAHFAERGVRPLDPATVLARRELAEQPLLLLMLALYDADGNALRAAGELRRDELYERLLRSFARREVAKLGSALPPRELDLAIESELRRLSVVACAMFNRGVQWVAEHDLEADLAALPVLAGGPRSAAPGDTGLRAPLRPAEIVLGRFFFVHRSQASRDDTRLETYEFLHATFGEYLVARLVWLVLRDIAAREAAATMTLGGGGPVDDDLLHALLSYAVLSGRAPIVAFLGELMSTAGDEEREAYADLLVRLFRVAHQGRPGRRFDSYQPRGLPVPARHAVYGANLVLLAVCAAGRLTGRRLYPDRNVVPSWYRETMLWQSQLGSQDWNSIVDILELERLRHPDGERDIALTLAVGDAPPVDPLWTFDMPVGPPWPGQRSADTSSTAEYFVKPNQSFERLSRAAYLRCSLGDDVLVHALEPLAEALPYAISEFRPGRYRGWSVAHGVLTMLVLPLLPLPNQQREDAYLSCADLVWSDGEGSITRMLIDRLATDPETPTELAAKILSQLLTVSVHGAELYDRFIACALTFLRPGEPATSEIAGLLRDVLVANRFQDKTLAAEAVVRLVELRLISNLDWVPEALFDFVEERLELRARVERMLGPLERTIAGKQGPPAADEATISGQ
ncbi:hypothetical protein AB0J86_30835 [Micromonospora sp. NPDC049559]|uniref:NACHT domain-containing protein n=1 Tax=Micromonospora sp. NPDC049559 TaxID=3155923 RepID=UPI0034265EA9